VVSLSLTCAALCGAVSCKDSSHADADHGSESEDSSGDGDGEGDGDGDTGDGDGDGDTGDGDGDGDPGDGDGDGDGDPQLDMPPGPDGCVVHVNQATGNDSNLGLTWIDAKATVQAGLEAVFMRADCQVWVAEGTYHPTDGGMPDDRSLSFTLDGQSIYGGFSGVELALDQRDWIANPTILSGEIGAPGDSTDNSHHVVQSLSGGWIDGFEIRDGSTRGLTMLQGRDGAGIHGFNGSLTVANSVIANNIAGSGLQSENGPVGGLGGNGAGIYFLSGALTLDNVTVSGNRSGSGGPGMSQGGNGGLGGGLYAIGTTIEIRDSVFSANHTGDGGNGMNNFGGHGGTGAGAMIDGGSVIVVDSVFEANVAGVGGTGPNAPGSPGGHGGLSYIANDDTTLIIANSEFVANHAAFGAGIQLQTSGSPGASVLIINSVIRANEALWSSGGMQLLGDGSASVVIANTAIVANQAPSAAGLVYSPLDAIGPEQPRLVNSILWGNLAQSNSQIFSSSFAQTPMNLLVDATDIQGGCIGATDNLECLVTHDLDPEFANLLVGDLHLMPGSPLEDLGSLDHLPPDLADLDEDGDVDEPTPLDLDELERVVGAAPELGPLEIP
jgi:hypothetical protein